MKHNPGAKPLNRYQARLRRNELARLRRRKKSVEPTPEHAAAVEALKQAKLELKAAEAVRRAEAAARKKET